MKEWNNCIIDDLGTVIGGSTPKTSISEYWDGNIPWITPRDMSQQTGKKYISNGERFITEKGLKNSSARLLPKGTVLFTSRAPIGYIGIAAQAMATNQGFKSIVVNETNSNEFVYYLLKHSVDKIIRMAGGSTFKEINSSNFKQIEIKVPPFPTQHRIAAILSALDNKIENNRRICETLEQIAQAIFKRWFVDEKNDSWTETGIGEVLDVKLGGTPATKIPEYWDGDIPWINSGEINKFRVFKPTRNITKLGLEKSATKLLPQGSTLIAITGTTLGQVSLLEIDCSVNQSVVGIIPNEEIPREYVYLWTKHIIKDLISHQTGGAQQHINKNVISNAIIFIPPVAIKRKFLPVLGNIFNQITELIFETETLTKTRDTLLPKLMSGEVEV